MIKDYIRLIRILIVVVFCSLLFPRKIYAYLDPGTGSYLFQIVIAALLGGLYMAKIYWNKIKFFFTKRLFFKKKKHEKPKN